MEYSKKNHLSTLDIEFTLHCMLVLYQERGGFANGSEHRPALTSKFLILSIFHDLLICNYYLIKSTLFLVYNTPFILLSLKKLLLTLISMTSGVIILVGYFPSYLEGAIDIPYVFGTQNFISKCLFYFIS